MVPPRLTLVSNNTRDRDDDSSGKDMDGREAAPQTPSYSDPEAAVDTLAARARREKLRRLEALSGS